MYTNSSTAIDSKIKKPQCQNGFGKTKEKLLDFDSFTTEFRWHLPGGKDSM